MSDTVLKKLARAIAGTRTDEISCKECFEELDRYAELARSGESAEERMPQVKEHLDRCADCMEEYEALREALREIE